MMDIRKWPIPPHLTSMSAEELAACLYQRAYDAGRDNMGMPDLLLAEAARRLLGDKGFTGATLKGT